MILIPAVSRSRKCSRISSTSSSTSNKSYLLRTIYEISKSRKMAPIMRTADPFVQTSHPNGPKTATLHRKDYDRLSLNFLFEKLFRLHFNFPYIKSTLVTPQIRISRASEVSVRFSHFFTHSHSKMFFLGWQKRRLDEKNELHCSENTIKF